VKSPEPVVSPARRAGIIAYLVVLGFVVLALGVVTLLLLAGLVTDPAEFTDQIPPILIGLVMTAGGGLYIYRRLRRLGRG
jgi:hypothetical protein